MKGFRGWLRIGGFALVGALALLASVLVAALAVNQSDRPPSSDARAMTAVLDSLPDVPDDENAYVYLLGFAAPADADPRRIGRERADWIRRLRTDHSLGRDTDPYPSSLAAVWNPEPNAYFRKCPSAREELECFAILTAAGDDVDAWLSEQRWVLARYETLLGHDSWREIETGDLRSPSPSFSNATDARSVWLLEAWAPRERCFSLRITSTSSRRS